MTIKLKLDLKKHCIQTELIKLYNKAVNSYFKGIGNIENLEFKIESLKNVLSEYNFGKLRTVYPELSGGSDCNVLMIISKNQISLHINNKLINLKDI